VHGKARAQLLQRARDLGRRRVEQQRDVLARRAPQLDQQRGEVLCVSLGVLQGRLTGAAAVGADHQGVAVRFGCRRVRCEPARARRY
jgi:hypothetical protein